MDIRLSKTGAQHKFTLLILPIFVFTNRIYMVIYGLICSFQDLKYLLSFSSSRLIFLTLLDKNTMKKLIFAGLLSIITFHTAVNAKTEEPIQFAQLAPAKPAIEKPRTTNMRENKKIMLNQEEVEKNAKQKQPSSSALGTSQADRLLGNRGYNDPTQTDNPGLGHDRGFNKGKSEKDNNRFNNANPPNKIHRSNNIHMGVPAY